MNFKKYVLSFSLVLCYSFLFAEEPQIVSTPATPVCMGNSCPYVVQNGDYKASITCAKLKGSSTEFNCTLTASNGGSVTTTQQLEDNFDPNLTPLWLSPTLLEIADDFQQGKYAYFNDRSVFVEFTNLEISPVFFSVYALNLDKLVVLCESAEIADQTNDKEVRLIPMFNPHKSIAIIRDFQGTFIHSVYPQSMSHFLKNGDLQLVYLNTKRQRITEIVPVDYTALGLGVTPPASS